MLLGIALLPILIPIMVVNLIVRPFYLRLRRAWRKFWDEPTEEYKAYRDYRSERPMRDRLSRVMHRENAADIDQ